MTTEDPGVGGAATPDVIGNLRAEEQHLRGRGRQILGITGDEVRVPLLTDIRQSGARLYPLTVLSLMSVIQSLGLVAFNLVAPDIAQNLGISISVIATINLVSVLAVTAATLPVAALVQNHPRRALLVLTTGVAGAVCTVYLGFVVNEWGLVLGLVAVGILSGSVTVLHTPLLMDSYPPSTRVRVFSIYNGAARVSGVLAPLLVAVCTGVLGLTWRGVFVISGLVCLVGMAFCLRLRDPGFGRFDVGRVQKLVQEESSRHRRAPRGTPRDSTGTGPEVAQPLEVGLHFFEICRRLFLIPTVRRVLMMSAMLGAFIFPFQIYIQFFFQQRWGLDTSQRSLLFGSLPIFTIPALVWFGRRGEGMFRADPVRLIRLMSRLVLGAVSCVIVAVLIPVFPLMILFFGLGFMGFIAFAPALGIVMLSIVHPNMRPHQAALNGIYSALVGGAGGILLLQGIDSRFGITAALVAMCVPGFGVALIVRGAAKTINADIDRLVDEVVEEEELRTMRAAGRHLPMLACRHINFSYGAVQVLFDVNFTVDDGEAVALLGTNGAGKSTLLRVIAGLGIPFGGTVHFRGADITYLDAERRTPLGLTTVLGGRATFSAMSVIDNLRVYGYTQGRNRRQLETRIDAVMETFPRLDVRRNAPSTALSGGEQQMLAVAQAYMVRPQMLLIDELSLGLAPVVVSSLLEMVKRINAEGCAIVLVEQSVNIALSVVAHAYFMEKGQIAFDGDSAELLGHTELLRSVFLEGVAHGRP